MGRSRRLALPGPAPVAVAAPIGITRPPGSLLQFERLPLSRVHRLFLALAIGYLLLAYPEASGPILVVGLAGLIAEFAPSRWRGLYFAEIACLLAGGTAFLWAWQLGGEAGTGDARPMLGWVRMLITVWILVPCRPGFLRFLAILAGLELLLIGAFGPRQLGAWPSAVLVPLAVGALYYDSRLRIGAAQPLDVLVGRQPLRLLRPAILMPVVLVALCALIGAFAFSHLQRSLQQRGLGIDGPGLPGSTRRLQQVVGMNQEQWSDQDDVVIARLYTDQSTGPGQHYLRAYTAPHLTVEGTDLVWRPLNPIEHQLLDHYDLHDGHSPRMALLVKEPGIGDMILRPDHCCRVEIYGQQADDDGNLMIDGFAELQRTYGVDLGAESSVPPDWVRWDLDECLYLPEQLDRQLAERIPELASWRHLREDEKAVAVSQWLRDRCRYDLKDLPTPLPGHASRLFTFMLDPDPARRRGHCQYFATAAAVLLRKLGVAARVVVGFSSDEVGSKGILYRALGAHAWVEIAYRDGEDRWRWWRVDPTPPGHLDERREGVELDQDELINGNLPPPPTPPPPTAPPTLDGSPTWPALLGGGLLVALGLLVWWMRRHERHDPHQAFLRRQTEDLVGLALELGIAVQPATSLSHLAAAVAASAGWDLDGHLHEHLAARFGHGPRPRPWPIAELRAAALARLRPTASDRR